MMARSVRPGYFDWPWESIVVPFLVDSTSGHDFRGTDSTNWACTEFFARHYPAYVTIYTDGAVDPASGRIGCGFDVEGDNFRYDLSLQLFTSVLSAELYAILRAVHYAGRPAMSRVLILNDSMKALTCLGDCLAVLFKNYLVFKIAHLLAGLAGLADLGRVVKFMWVPGHFGIAADGVGRTAGNLPYSIQYGLPFCDLYGPVGRDFKGDWGCLLLAIFFSSDLQVLQTFVSTPEPAKTLNWFVTRLRTSHVCGLAITRFCLDAPPTAGRSGFPLRTSCLTPGLGSWERWLDIWGVATACCSSR